MTSVSLLIYISAAWNETGDTDLFKSTWAPLIKQRSMSSGAFSHAIFVSWRLWKQIHALYLIIQDSTNLFIKQIQENMR